MKIALISDIHGNYEALKSVLSDIERFEINHIFCLGDVVGYYSQVNECCDELREREIPTIMGNHDWYMASGSFCPRSQSVNDCLEYLRKVIRPDNLAWLRDLPVHREFQKLKMVHGGWTDPIDEYLRPKEDYFSKIDGEFFVSGHTHVATIRDFKNKVYCNPGSVGQPRDGDPRASYAIFDSGKFSIHRVDYDRQKVYALMERAGFDDYYYGCLEIGSSRLCKLKTKDNV